MRHCFACSCATAPLSSATASSPGSTIRVSSRCRSVDLPTSRGCMWCRCRVDGGGHARETLANWPAAHYGYRERDVREVVSLLDEAISDLRASAGRNDFKLALVATPAETGYEPLLGAPSIIEQIDATFRAARLTPHVADRVSLLQESLALVAEAGAALSPSEASRLRRLAEEQIHEEAVIDDRYAALTRRSVASATNAAAQARIGDIERIINRIAKEDAQLGRRRPEGVKALAAPLDVHLQKPR